MNSKSILKDLIILGGIVEICIGILFLLFNIIFEHVGILNTPVFAQMAGSFLIGYGILLLFSSRNLERYQLIPLINILIRGLVIISGILTFQQMREFITIFIIAILYDSSWSILVLILIQKNKLLSMQS